MKKDSIGNRMKDNYEDRYRIKLTRRMPVIIRLDGKAFHTLTKNREKPFDLRFRKSMVETALYLCREIQGAKCAYVQSDEISILLTDFDRLTTEAWFDYNLQKMTSISAAIASTYFTKDYCGVFEYALFDSRAFNIPKEEVCNYFIWRQQDWTRNSLQMLARSCYSHKELHNKNSADIHDMLHTIGRNWNDLNSRWKNGVFIENGDGEWIVHHDLIFTKEREVVDRYLEQVAF